MVKFSRSDAVPRECWKQDACIAVFDSLLEIGASHEAIGDGTHKEAKAAFAAAQNQDAKAEAMNNLDWAHLALGEAPVFQVGSKDPESVSMVKMAKVALIETYNNRPDVVLSANTETERQAKRARVHDEEGDDLGILFGQKKARTVEQVPLVLNANFLEVHSPSLQRAFVFELVLHRAHIDEQSLRKHSRGMSASLCLHRLPCCLLVSQLSQKKPSHVLESNTFDERCTHP